MPGYHKHADSMNPADYARAKRRNLPKDPELHLYHKYHIKVLEPPVVVKDYMGKDSEPESCGWGTLVKWDNPFHGKPKILLYLMACFFKV